IDQELLLPITRLEWLSLLQAERCQHRRHHPVPRVDGFLLHALVEALPVRDAPRLDLRPRLATDWPAPLLGGLGVLRIRIEPEALLSRSNLVLSRIEHPDTGEEVVGGDMEHAVTARFGGAGPARRAGTFLPCLCLDRPGRGP